MSDRFAIVVEGIDDATLVTAIEETIRDSFREMALPGSWRVMVRPSAISGQWDCRVYGLNARHSLAVAAPSELLPSVFARRLEGSLPIYELSSLKTGAA